MGNLCVKPSIDSTPPGSQNDNESQAHVPPQREAVLFERHVREWNALGGQLLEPLLQSGAIALLDAAWLIQIARAGESIRPRQQIPYDAFLSVQELQASLSGAHKWLPIICLSYPWLHPEHPDPHNTTLSQLVNVLEKAVQVGRFGVFWDFASLHQHPAPARGKYRNSMENALFEKGLSGLATFYAHAFTYVIRLTRMPSGYPEAFDLKPGANSAEYSDRGWCFTESCWSCMIKCSRLCLDLGKFTGTATSFGAIVDECIAHRPVPIIPKAFDEQLMSKSFTNGHTDRPKVSVLYRKHFTDSFCKATKLMYYGLKWNDENVKSLVQLLETGLLVDLKLLDLNDNLITDLGARTLAGSLSSIPTLKELRIRNNRITASVMHELEAAAQRHGVRVQLEEPDHSVA